jgi:Tfp pilus assembly protein PilN
MRPVNLIPPEDRRGEHAPLRTGPLPYVLLGALVALLIGVTAVVLLNNQIADSKSEVAKLEGEDAAAAAKAQRLASYTEFRNMSEQRVATVNSLADSRFDWERVMRELSRVLPSNVWLTDLTGTAGGGTDAASGAPASGPTLTISGCAVTQDGVAGFLSALRDIDGVTRVGLSSSARPSGVAGGGTSAGGDSAGGGAGSDCATKDFIAQFDIQVAFDKAPAPQSATAAPTAPTTPTGTTPATTTPATTPAPTTPTDTGTPASATTP